jgi:3-oxoacyl-[acyl-carrier-protein] synthase II
MNARTADITGAAVITSLGRDLEEVWRNVRSGACGIRTMSAIERSVQPGADGGQSVDLPADYFADLPREARYLRWCVEAAIRSAGVDRVDDRTRVAVVLGTTLHGMREGGEFLRSGNFAHLSMFLAGDTAALALGDLLPRGMRITTCSACSSSLGAVALAQTVLECGAADVVVAGGYDAISEYAWGGFNSLKLVADGPLRPFAKNRRGMKIGEGYGIVILERPGQARLRNHQPLAQIAGWGESADAFHLTRPHSEGAGATAAMREAVESAGIAADRLDAVVAHATGTPENDAAEAAALRALLGDSLRDVCVAALKSHFGHTLGGAGVVELVMGLQMLRDGVVPPCANVKNNEIEFERLDVVCEVERRKPIRNLMSISLGFGGANTAVVVRQPVESPVSYSPPARQRVVITGVGALVPGAVGNDAFSAKIKAGGGDESSCVIADADMEKWIAPRRLRRLSGYVKLALCAATLAVRDAGLADLWDLLRPTAAIFASTHTSPGYCADYYRQIVKDGSAAANPMLFAEGVPNAASAHASLMLGLRGGCQTLIGTRTSGVDALSLAAMRVASGAVERVIVVAAEEQHELIDQAYAHCQPNKPVRATRSCSCAAGFVLEAADAAAARGGRAYAKIGAGRSVSGERFPLGELVKSVTNDRPARLLARPPVAMGGQPFSVEPLLALAGSLLSGEDGARALVAMDRRGDSVDGGIASVLLIEDFCAEASA